MGLRLNVNPALQLAFALPAAGTQIVSTDGKRGTWLAADAGVALIVQRQMLNAMAVEIAPDFLNGPTGQRADFLESLAAGQLERLDLLEIRASRRLFAA